MKTHVATIPASVVASATSDGFEGFAHSTDRPVAQQTTPMARSLLACAQAPDAGEARRDICNAIVLYGLTSIAIVHARTVRGAARE